ncbi:MAG: PEP-CTERM sorting domain-containing protein [Fimbriimonadales bacterium]
MRTGIVLATALGVVLLAEQAAAGGAVSTDRFGYTGTTTRYATLQDALDGTNPLETIEIGNRDLSLFIVKDLPDYYDDANVIMGSWWYTTQGSAGYGNTRGNTGIGFLQIYEDPSFSAVIHQMAFGGWDGTYWTTYTLNVSGANADYDSSYARFSPFLSNTNDKGTYLSYNLTLTATGLQGVLNGNVIESFNHPTGVTGTFSGLFLNQGNDPAKQGYYTFTMNLDMENWAFSQNGNLNGPYQDGGNIYPSYFAQTVPEPFTVGLAAAGLGLAALRRRRK